jgi:hypothetical protein
MLNIDLDSIYQIIIAVKFCCLSQHHINYCNNMIQNFLMSGINNVLQSHPNVPFEERSRLCKCLNYGKLSFGASKDLAKNPRIPPGVAMQALISQQRKIPTSNFVTESPRKSRSQIVVYNEANKDSFSQERKYIKLNLEGLQYKAVELEKLEEVNGQISNMFSSNVLLTPRARTLPRYC